MLVFSLSKATSSEITFVYDVKIIARVVAGLEQEIRYSDYMAQ